MLMNVFEGILIPFVGTTLGAACVFFMRKTLSKLLQRALAGFAAGIMIAASIWSLLIPAIEQSENMGTLSFVPAVVGFWIGILFLLALDHLIPHLHVGSDQAEGPKSKLGRTTMMVLAVTLHNIPEGMAVGVMYAGFLAGNTQITSTGALTALCKKLSKTFSKHKYVVIPVFLTLFSIFGFTMGMSSEVMIFVPIGITLALFLGLDKVTGTAMIALGAAVGFTAGLLNPFNVGVAQDIAELQLFSGMAYRVFILVVLLAATSAYIICYARKVAAHPEKSVIYGIPEDQEYTFDNATDTITVRQIAVLIVMALGFGILIYGLSKKGWYFEEMSGLFIFMGVICGFISGYGPSRIAREFGEGAKGIIVGCLIIGIARTVEVILSDANILDTIVYGIVNIVNVMPDSIKAVGMFLCQSLINCVIVSGTGQAAVTMPLMVPVSDLVGISRQTSVLAFQLGDGFSNSVLPMSSSLMGYLAVSKIPYSKWLKFMMPLFLIWTALGCLFMLGALIIGY